MGRGGKEAERDEEKKGRESASTQRDPSVEARSLHSAGERREGHSHTQHPTPQHLLRMLEGHQAPFVLSHHAPGHDQAIGTSRDEMPLVKEQALYGSLVSRESL